MTKRIPRNPPDLAVLDIKMPRMDGEELLKKLKKKMSVPIIFLTSKDDEVDELLGLKLGADDFVKKSGGFSTKVLIERIRVQLRKKTNTVDDTKNIICDDVIKNVKVRFQRVIDLPPKELRSLVDKGKKDLGEGVVIVISSKDSKVGLAVGVTKELSHKYNAVDFVKMGSIIIGGKGGGGRPDFAQAGGSDEKRINEVFYNLKFLI